MTTPTTTDFEAFVLSGAEPNGEFRPFATYDPDGDCIEFFATNENFYGKRLDSMVTVYYSMKTGEVVGSLIKDVSRITRWLRIAGPEFSIVIEGHKLSLYHVFTLCMLAGDSDDRDLDVSIYQQLKTAAANARVQVELRPAA